MRATAVCVACVALRSAAAFRPHAGSALSEPPQPVRESRLSVSQLSEQRAAPGVTIKYFSSLRDGANAGDEQLPGAVRQMRRKVGSDDVNWEHGRWLDGFWKTADDGESRGARGTPSTRRTTGPNTESTASTTAPRAAASRGTTPQPRSVRRARRTKTAGQDRRGRRRPGGLTRKTTRAIRTCPTTSAA